MRKSRIMAFALALILCAGLLSGCEEVQIFEDKSEIGKLKPVKNSELKQDTYYVKNGTDFYRTLPAAGSGANGDATAGIASLLDKSYVLYAVVPNDQLIPPHYKGEVVAYTSESGKTGNIVLERYRDMRYSIGFANAKYNAEEQSFSFKSHEQAIYNSDFYNKIINLESDEIRVVKIDGEPMTDRNSSAESGMITGLDKNSVHSVEFYAGTYYHKMDVTADTQVFQYFESFMYDDGYLSDTENGYRVFETPEDLKSGYYLINGKGLFKYIAAERGAIDEKSIYWNEQYYQDDNYSIQLFSQNFSVTLNKHLERTAIVAKIVPPGEGKEPAGYVFAPDGTLYKMEYNEKAQELRLNLQEAIAGKWKVCISPQTMTVESVEVENNADVQDLTQETFPVVLADAQENAWFRIPVETSGHVENAESVIVTGSIIAPDGATYDLIKREYKEDDGSKFFMEYNMPYAAAGTYTVNVNHYPERTTIGTPTVQEWDDFQTETIYVEG